MRYLFGEFELLPDRFELRRHGAGVHVEPRVLEMLAYLIAHRGRAIDKDELLENVWHQEYLSDAVLSRTARKLRQALGDSPRDPRFVKTVYGRGYVFIGSVETVEEDGEPPSRTTGPSPGSSTVQVQRSGAPSTGAIVGLGLGVTLLLGLGLAGLILLGSKDDAGRAGSAETPNSGHGAPGGGSHGSASAAAPHPSVAVLPLRSLVSDDSLDYLRVAIPSEITTLLDRVPALGVRPFSAALEYLDEPGEPRAAGEALGATYVVTGQYLQVRDELRLTLEAIDVESNSVVWRGTVAATPNDEIELMTRLTDEVVRGLLPLLGAVAGETFTRPRDRRAFSLYLRTLAMDTDPVPNDKAIAMLESSLDVDPGYAPAWAELSRRLYLDGFYHGGGPTIEERSADALGRALALDPDLVAAIVLSVALRTDNGDLTGAFDLVETLLERRPDHAEAYFARSYVFRFAGLQELSAADCERALALDPMSPRWRSCAFTMGYSGRFERAGDFLALGPASSWSHVGAAYLAIMRNDLPEAREQLRGPPDVLELWRPRLDLVEACLDHPSEVDTLADAAVAEVTRRPTDGEDLFALAQLLAACNRPARALTLLRSAVRGGFCAGSAFDREALRQLRDEPELAEIVGAATACTEAFEAHRRDRAARLAG